MWELRTSDGQLKSNISNNIAKSIIVSTKGKWIDNKCVVGSNMLYTIHNLKSKVELYFWKGDILTKR